ncbi:MAG: hypothetical protein WDA16_13980 [Candidatus Thermoplasmatota archaeon]
MTTFVPEHRIAFLVSRLNSGLNEDEHEGIFAELGSTLMRLMDNSFRGHYQAFPLHELYQRERVQVYSEKPWLDQAIRYALAHEKDISDIFHAHIQERRRYGGNVVLEFVGPTGSGKSSCMLGLMERHNGLLEKIRSEGPSAMRNRLSIDLQELPGKLEKLTAGDAVALDEQLHLAGEGATTALKMMRNLEDTLRGTMIDIYFASPGTRTGHDASQGVLEAISWSPPILRDGAPGLARTKFIVWLGLNGNEAIPLGYIDLPWASPDVFAAYKPIKEENLERTKRGQFHQTGEASDAIIRRLFETPALLERLHIRARPTKADWKRYLQRYAPTMSIAERDFLSAELEEMMLCLRDEPTRFQRIWGWEPTENMRRVADGEDTSAPEGGRTREL